MDDARSRLRLSARVVWRLIRFAPAHVAPSDGHQPCGRDQAQEGSRKLEGKHVKLIAETWYDQRAAPLQGAVGDLCDFYRQHGIFKIANIFHAMTGGKVSRSGARAQGRNSHPGPRQLRSNSFRKAEHKS